MLQNFLLLLGTLAISISLGRSNDRVHDEPGIGAIDRWDSAVLPARQSLLRKNASDDSVYLKDKFAPHYFSNLKMNYGNNVHNSCGFVATGILLSFWDTYWDDNVVEERYESHTILLGNHIALDAESPGATREDESTYKGVTLAQYYRNITTYKNDFLHYLLLDMGKTLFNFPAYPAPSKYSMRHESYALLFEEYLYEYRGYTNEEVSIEEYPNPYVPSETYDPESVRSKAIEYVKDGIPVLLSVTRDSDDAGHAVVAYDYDEDGDELYCHFGWDSDETHLTLKSKHFSVDDHLIALVFKNNHSHSDNYEYHGGNRTIAHCACETAAPSNIIDDFYYIDMSPIYAWDGLKEKWFLNKGHYEVRFLRSSNYTLFHRANALMGHELELSKEGCRAISRNISYDGSYIVEVALYEDDANTILISSYGRTCYSPTKYLSGSNVFLGLSLPRKSGNTWTVNVKNNTYVKIHGQYNRKMCNFNDAKYWTSSLKDIADFTIEPQSSIDINISENWFATSIVVSMVLDAKRYITYADNLSSGSLKSYKNVVDA
ncbi:MAG: hypothetical protein J6328_05795 [Bacilli bacterium]|nr:hypothetical protein [Bacilli bacterium]